ncbi:glycosyltransferase family 8 protein [Lichenifustis flavocetrariae]|uniref:Uncharacterized protein n=1 Tax=Lichenifustis flavocetrariae TaxID=2949735 RepID=A0AA41Z210_9HYPH|nr:glycosyltransferase [Lichenifustis flavocetrariae]MCW6509038.1 hypothetical protein [Lichenifustis flavocetrariae]
MGATLLSAMQARRQLTAGKADVLILYLGPQDHAAGVFADICAQHDIVFQPITARCIDDLPIQFARHFLDRLLDRGYAHVIHADGDTQVTGPLDPLFDVSLPSGRVLVTPDPMAVMIREPSRSWQARRAYFQSIGIPDARLDRYFNSGIFRLNRTDLAEVGRECVRLCRQYGPVFRFSEQDAFNLAFGEDAQLMSFKWNFPVFFLNGGYDATIQPRLIHYMSNPRPWHGAFLPWGRTTHRVYRDLVGMHPELAEYLQPMRGLKAVKYRAQQRYKRLVEQRTWTRPAVRERVAQFERNATV